MEVTAAALVRQALGGIPWTRAKQLCRSGKVRIDGRLALDDAQRFPSDARVEVDLNARAQRRGTLAQEAIVHVDRDVVVVRKPAGMLSVPYATGDRDTLVDVTRAALRRGARTRYESEASPAPRKEAYDPQLGVVHRLDKDTTGLLVFARTLSAKRHLQQQFRERTVNRRYLALVHGAANDATWDTMLVSNRGDGLRGSWGVFRAKQGKQPVPARRAITRVHVVERLRGATLLECRLRTGRQHQIRIHVSESGHPLVGENVYIRDYEGPRIPADRPMLHAATLGFVHPRTEQQLSFEDPPPDDFTALLAKLRRT